MKQNKCNKNTDKKLTIRNLINSLEEVMSRNPDITLDSEIVISDLNLSFFKKELKIHPIYDCYEDKTKVGLYLNPYEKNNFIEEIEEETKPKDKNSNLKDRQVLSEIITKSSQPTSQEEIKTPKGMSWLEKYRR